MDIIYLDNAATTPVAPAAQAAMTELLANTFGNPSSLHRLGIEAERALDEARARVAASVGARPEEIVFTSGGTEANVLALFGAARLRARRKKHIITTQIEHSSVLNACARLEEEGFSVTALPVDGEGLINPAQVVAALQPDTALVSVMAVNNEIGTVQPVAAIAEAVKQADDEVWVHVDAVQALGNIPINLAKTRIDYASFSAHKIHGPKGSGALWIRTGARLASPYGDGSQERGVRPGTENVPGIVGFGAAAEEVTRRAGATSRVAQLREMLWQGIEAGLGEKLTVVRNGPKEDKHLAPHILNVSFVGLKGEVLLHALAEAGVYASTGSACSSRGRARGGPLRAIGLSEEAVEGTLRFSLSTSTTEAHIAAAVDRIVTAVGQLIEFVR